MQHSRLLLAPFIVPHTWPHLHTFALRVLLTLVGHIFPSSEACARTGYLEFASTTEGDSSPSLLPHFVGEETGGLGNQLPFMHSPSGLQHSTAERLHWHIFL